jgi:hypothetical protein
MVSLPGVRGGVEEGVSKQTGPKHKELKINIEEEKLLHTILCTAQFRRGMCGGYSAWKRSGG